MIVKKDDIIYGIYSYDEMFGEEINCTEFKVISVKNNKIIVQDENKDLYTYNNFEDKIIGYFEYEVLNQDLEEIELQDVKTENIFKVDKSIFELEYIDYEDMCNKLKTVNVKYGYEIGKQLLSNYDYFILLGIKQYIDELFEELNNDKE